MNELMTVGDVAAFLGIATSTVYTLCKNGLLHPAADGMHNKLFDREHVEDVKELRAANRKCRPPNPDKLRRCVICKQYKTSAMFDTYEGGMYKGRCKKCEGIQALITHFGGEECQAILVDDPTGTLVVGFGVFKMPVFVDGLRHENWPEGSLWKFDRTGQMFEVREGTLHEVQGKSRFQRVRHRALAKAELSEHSPAQVYA